ncbi:type II toxin-antitoxin system YafQ family toxin [Lamprocystis purpurea]|uniref:type II toxin-antitoxin system YafQ family toxin n=1 Tax=Lamprocystis purpurea TaxID=61598 RepID=UPI0009FE90F9|nr:type II toxin-antitoxin system YafQ family toxin [Lamprocystis purpurea]
MTSTGPAASKRAIPPRAADYTKSFLKDWQRLTRSGRFDMRRLKEAMLLLIANDGPLGPEWLDHPLVGDWEGHRECHSRGDHRFPDGCASRRNATAPDRRLLAPDAPHFT